MRRAATPTFDDRVHSEVTEQRDRGERQPDREVRRQERRPDPASAATRALTMWTNRTIGTVVGSIIAATITSQTPPNAASTSTGSVPDRERPGHAVVVGEARGHQRRPDQQQPGSPRHGPQRGAPGRAGPASRARSRSSAQAENRNEPCTAFWPCTSTSGRPCRLPLRRKVSAFPR